MNTAGLGADQTVTYLTAATLLVTLIGGGIRLLQKQKKDRDEIEHALDNQPQIRDQLEVGNFRGAIEALNLANENLGRVLNRERHDHEAQLKRTQDELARCNQRCDRLEARVELLLTALRNNGIPVPPGAI